MCVTPAHTAPVLSPVPPLLRGKDELNCYCSTTVPISHYYYSPLFNKMYTFKQTYSSILSLIRRNMIVICVILSTI